MSLKTDDFITILNYLPRRPAFVMLETLCDVYMLKHYIRHNLCDDWNRALYCSFKYDMQRMQRYLLHNENTSAYSWALWGACKAGNIAALELILENQACDTSKIISVAASKGHPSVVYWAVERGIIPSEHAFPFACLKNDNMELIEYLRPTQAYTFQIHRALDFAFRSQDIRNVRFIMELIDNYPMECEVYRTAHGTVEWLCAVTRMLDNNYDDLVQVNWRKAYYVALKENNKQMARYVRMRVPYSVRYRKRLYAYARRGKVKKFVALLETFPELVLHVKHWTKVMCLAARGNCVELVELAAQRCHAWQRALLYGIMGHNWPIVHLCIRRIEQLHNEPPDYGACMLTAIGYNYDDMVLYFMKQPIDNAEDLCFDLLGSGNTYWLYRFIVEKDVDMLTVISEACGYGLWQDELLLAWPLVDDKEALLEIALNTGEVELAKAMIRHGCKVSEDVLLTPEVQQLYDTLKIKNRLRKIGIKL